MYMCVCIYIYNLSSPCLSVSWPSQVGPQYNQQRMTVELSSRAAA